MLDNLLCIALKFTPAGGRVAVGLELDDHHGRVYVEDTGSGLSAEEIGRLFQPFMQIAGKAHGID